jgi:hypothetical protein
VDFLPDGPHVEVENVAAGRSRSVGELEASSVRALRIKVWSGGGVGGREGEGSDEDGGVVEGSENSRVRVRN